MAVTMKDIARDLGVSVVTVSKVIRNSGGISEATRQRVLKRMKELKYRPNLAARALVTGRSFSVGLIVPDLVHPFFAELAKGLSGVLRSKGYSLIISSSEEDADLERSEIEQLLSRRVDALLIASTQWSVESFRRIEEHETPYVLVDRKFIGLAANFVGVDDELVGRIGTEHLIVNGYRTIAHIAGAHVSPAVGRLEGYRRALSRHNLDIPADYVIQRSQADDSGDVTGYQSMKTLLGLDPRPDAVFCYNDSAAVGAMKAILDSGLRIPQDVALVGCGDTRYCDVLRVPLSSVGQDTHRLGDCAAGLVLSLIDAQGLVIPKTILVEPTLVARASSAPRT